MKKYNPSQNEYSKFNRLTIIAFSFSCLQAVLLFSGVYRLESIGLVLQPVIFVVAIVGFNQTHKKLQKGKILAIAAVAIQIVSMNIYLDRFFLNWFT